MAWAVIGNDPVFNDRVKQKRVRPAVFVYLDWPTGVVRASTHHRTVTTTDTDVSPAETAVWSGVGNLAMIEAPSFERSGALVTYKIGLTSLPQQNIDDATEAAAIGRRARLYLGLADEAWSDWRLQLKFTGHIINTGDFKHTRQKDGSWLTDATLEISNGRSPRRQLELYHSPATAASGDTAWRLTATVAKALAWPG